MTLADTLRPYVAELKNEAARGCAVAQNIIGLYRMHVACSSDPGAPALCKAAFDEWVSSRKGPKP